MNAKVLTPILNGSDFKASVEWNVREMHVRHPDGHVFRISRGTGEK